MSIKTIPFRDDASFLEEAMAKAKELGTNLTQVMRTQLRQWLGMPEDTRTLDTVTGAAAEVMIADGTCYNWSGKKRINSMLPVHVVTHGKLWLVDRTKNYSHKILRSVCVLPQCIISTVGEARGDLVPKLLDLTSDDLVDRVANLLQVEAMTWFQEMHHRQQSYVIDAALNGDTLEQLIDYYAPKPVITEVIEPQPEEPQETVITTDTKKPEARDKQLRKRYSISADEWHANLSTWKREGLKTVDGLVWRFIRYSNMWLAS
jgi:hypothetical protein